MKHHIHARSWADQQCITRRIAYRERLYTIMGVVGICGIGACVGLLAVIYLST